MSINGEINWQQCAVLPLLMLWIGEFECGHCPNVIVLTVGWLFFTVNIVLGEEGHDA